MFQLWCWPYITILHICVPDSQVAILESLYCTCILYVDILACTLHVRGNPTTFITNVSCITVLILVWLSYNPSSPSCHCQIELYLLTNNCTCRSPNTLCLYRLVCPIYLVGLLCLRSQT